MPHLKFPGRYKAEVIEAKVSTATKGTPYVCLYLRTDEEEHCDGYLYFSDKAFARSVKTLTEVFGFNGDFETVSSQVVGKRCSIIAEQEEDDRGEVRVRVKWINPEVEAPANTSLLARLSARAKALGLCPSVVTKEPVPSAPAAKPTPEEEDNLPF